VGGVSSFPEGNESHTPTRQPTTPVSSRNQ
jgi:hypothetical protein